MASEPGGVRVWTLRSRRLQERRAGEVFEPSDTGRVEREGEAGLVFLAVEVKVKSWGTSIDGVVGLLLSSADSGAGVLARAVTACRGDFLTITEPSGCSRITVHSPVKHRPRPAGDLALKA